MIAVLPTFRLAATGIFGFDPNTINSQGLNAVPALIANAINLAMFAVGFLSIIFIVIAGIKYSASMGEPAAQAAAKKTLTYAIGGLVLAMSALLIVNFISPNILNPSAGPGGIFK